jgi:hypothetical protein
MNPKARWQLPTGWCSWMIFLSHCNACDELFIWLVLPEPVDIIELNIRRPHQLCKLYQVGCGNGNACIVEVYIYIYICVCVCMKCSSFIYSFHWFHLSYHHKEIV